MHRTPVAQRPDLEDIARAHGYEYQPGSGIPFWDETAFYQFTMQQIEEDLAGATEAIADMCYEFLDRAMVDETVFQQLKIPEKYWDYVADSWKEKDKDLYGRMDFSYGGDGPAKLLEFNADTPTTLYEAAIFQWEWLEQAKTLGLIPDDADQAAEIHEALLTGFRGMNIQGPLHLACLYDQEDDRETAAYMEDCAQEAGLETVFLNMRDIGIDASGHFTDLDDQVITTLFKLYPWEWIMAEDFGPYLMTSGVHFLEPPWKAVLANKGLLPLLWEMFDGHPNLLPAYFDGDDRMADFTDGYVRKPLLSRQGSNIEIVRPDGTTTSKDDSYGEEGYVVQAFHPLPEFDGRYPMSGYWLVAGQAAGLSIRETAGLITDAEANVLPHVILD